jgi:hypothetical protein
VFLFHIILSSHHHPIDDDIIRRIEPSGTKVRRYCTSIHHLREPSVLHKALHCRNLYSQRLPPATAVFTPNWATETATSSDDIDRRIQASIHSTFDSPYSFEQTKTSSIRIESESRYGYWFRSNKTSASTHSPVEPLSARTDTDSNPSSSTI